VQRAGRAGSLAVRQPGRARDGAPQFLSGRRGSVDRRPVQESGAAAGGLACARALPRDQCAHCRRQAHAGPGCPDDPRLQLRRAVRSG
nr:hypothetical protein [Tanacetum cinerariifolium]